eukprot:XP_001702792.1 predicted protein [Chlamydomonas reinhardtii]
MTRTASPLRRWPWVRSAWPRRATTRTASPLRRRLWGWRSWQSTATMRSASPLRHVARALPVRKRPVCSSGHPSGPSCTSGSRPTPPERWTGPRPKSTCGGSSRISPSVPSSATVPAGPIILGGRGCPTRRLEARIGLTLIISKNR